MGTSLLGRSGVNDLASNYRSTSYDEGVIRSAWWVLRQRRYLRLAVLLLFVAVGCVVAGTWQISRYEQTARVNRALDGNAHAAVVPMAALGVPLVGRATPPGREAIRYRTVTAAGTYLVGAQEFLRDQYIDGRPGFYVVDPLRIDRGVIPVVRGFVAADSDGNPPASVAAPPTGVQRIVGRLQTAGSGSDAAGALPDHEIESINPGEQATRLGVSVFDAYLTLKGSQAGTAGLTLAPEPNLSNPAGGAVEPQHLAYIVQWYLFALLALAAPFVIARSEIRGARQKFLGFDPAPDKFAAMPAATRPDLPAGVDASAAAVVATREPGTLAVHTAAQAQVWDRAQRLASRYGRSLSAGNGWRPDPASFPADAAGPAVRKRGDVVSNSAERPHRSPDAYHGAYNDYLWRLALADGQLPSGAAPHPQVIPGPEPDGLEPTAVRGDKPTVITSLAAADPSPPPHEDGS